MTISLEIGLNPVSFGYFKTYFYTDANDMRSRHKLLDRGVLFVADSWALYFGLLPAPRNRNIAFSSIIQERG